ncbi:MAG: CRISPR-associated ring nuclease Crn3/Csx3 [Ignavibacteria bacterium]|nr:CRISPR-associated ring nuclease Crn3/Csx3 [Ignavibacteria bacterium]
MKNLKLSLIDTPENFQILEIILENDGIISPEEISSITIPEEINWAKGIVIFGRAPIWLYSYLVHRCHPSAWVAVYDPRYGGIVVEAHKTDSPNVGEVLEQERILKYRNSFLQSKKIIAFLGNPHTGKSVFLRAVRRKLREILPIDKFNRELFLIKACPDGEGDWFEDLGEKEGRIYRYKNQFTLDFVDKVCRDIDSISNEKSLIFVDCGGKIDKFNQMILNKCTHSIILGRDDESMSEWRGAAKLCELNILCEVESSLEYVSKILTVNPLKIKFGPLDRSQKQFPDLPKELIDKLV